jgi:CRP/FNR family transcriptional regulator, cyclic AMP receptor protein
MNQDALTLVKQEKLVRLEYLLGEITKGKQLLNYQKNQTIFSQGDPANAVFFIRRGQIKLAVVSIVGKEATLSILGPQEFFGVGCLGQQTHRMSSASTLEPTVLIRIEKNVMLWALREKSELFDAFLSGVLNRTINLQKDLCNQILEPSEKRLMRILLNLSQFGEERQGRIKMPWISHEVLASMVGTTRSRVTFFINKFRKLGFIEQGRGILLHPSRMSTALQENQL